MKILIGVMEQDAGLVRCAAVAGLVKMRIFPRSPVIVTLGTPST
jgi:hypothetical protein